MLVGVDVSNVNSSAVVTSAIAKTAAFAFVKATEGRGWTDPTHDATVAKARAARRLVGHYHYHWPEEDPIVQMRHFLAVAKPQPGELVAIDLERASGTWGQRLTSALSALAYVKANTHASPLLYLNGSWITGLRSAASPALWSQLTSYPLWVAAWNGHAGSPGGIGGWPLWTMHQWADGPGTDRDVFNGDAGTWARLAVPHPVAYVPKPAPKAPAPAPRPPAPKPAPAPAPLEVTVKTPAVATATTLTIHLEP